MTFPEIDFAELQSELNILKKGYSETWSQFTAFIRDIQNKRADKVKRFVVCYDIGISNPIILPELNLNIIESDHPEFKNLIEKLKALVESVR